MATAYVSPTGSASYPGTVGAPTSLATALSSAGAGDIVYLAPGSYRGTFTLGVSGTSGNTIQFIGDPTASQGIGGISAGIVRITNYLNDNTNPTDAVLFTATSRNYWSFSNIYFEAYRIGYGYSLATCTNWSFDKCVFVNVGASGFIITTTANVSLNASFTKCFFSTNSYAVELNCPNHTSPYNLQMSFTDCISASNFVGLYAGGLGSTTNAGGTTFYNCTVKRGTCLYLSQSNTVHVSYVYNCILNGGSGFSLYGGSGGSVVENYNRLVGGTSSITPGANSFYSGAIGLDYGYSAIKGISAPSIDGPYLGSRLLGAGTATGAPATDIDGVTWYQSLLGIGAYTYAGRNNVITFPAVPTPNTITIAPGSTSQSIELLLGVVGLTASTSGLSARYNRTRTASVNIPLVARTIAQAWTSGGFAEVDATNMPGVYRLDLPDAALAAGADDVTVVVRGASGTNGAVMTVKLSSGGLTSAQTASAVWGASPAGYNDATTFGGVVNQIDSTVTSMDTNVSQLPITVWDEPKSNHTTAGTFGYYLDAKVSDVADASRIQLRQGPFLIKQNAVDSVITEVNQFLSTTPNIEMVLIDSSGGSVSVAGSTLVMRVRNQAGTAVVNNITPTVAYADGGVIRWSPNQSWNALGVTTAGTYRIVVERTMSGVTTTFGPFLVQLSSG